MIAIREKYRDVPAFPEKGEIDLNAILGGEGPIELEIGFGTGSFLLDRAKANPYRRIVGIETKRKLVRNICDKVAQRSLQNASVFHADALKTLSRIVPDSSIEKVFINFPDPWWKKRHAKRLLMVPELLAEIERLLARGGDLFVQTDVDFRAGQYFDLISSSKKMAPVHGNGFLLGNPYEERSPREVRCEQAGLDLYRILFRKTE